MFRFSLILLVLISISLPVAAQKKISILGFEAETGLEKKAKMATKLFRKYAGRDKNLSLLPSKEVEEVKLEYCDGEKDTPKECLVKIARNLKADVLITGRFTKKGNQVKVSVSFLANGTMNYVYKVFPVKTAQKIYEMKIYELWTGYFKGMKSRVVIQSPQPGASVMVDGTFLFKTVPGANEIPQITPGSHEIKVVHKDLGEFTKTITVKAGESVTVDVIFPKKGGPVIIPKDNSKPLDNGNNAPIKDEPKKPGKPLISFENGSMFWKTTFWTTAVLSGAMLAGGIYFGLQVSKYEDDKKALLDPNIDAHRGSDVCSGATGDLKSVCDDGKASAMNANIFLAAGAVVAVVSSFFLYKGYLADEPTVSGNADAQGDAGKVTILPIFTPTGGGVSIGTRF
ncbi:PEGA domain-containing protein [Myxococcota bacterium]|nr:PEGA domain-containing protein [Myxococcota bacterium]MBU1538017.1 PEGA domain-containing protein [Myxococcota bacterium]